MAHVLKQLFEEYAITAVLAVATLWFCVNSIRSTMRAVRSVKKQGG